MNIDVFISYHTSTCKDIATAIVNKLEGKGIRCWYAARDIVHDDYAIQIHEAIQSCKVFLVLLNKESSESEDVLNEIHIAIQRVREHADISIMTFRLADRDEINPEAKYFLGRKHWIDGVEPELKERIDELIPQVLSTLGEKEGAFHNIENEEKQTPAISSPVINSNINFIGRDDFLIELHEMLKHEAKIFVQGLGGIGKSEAVRQYIRKYGNEYDTVIFLQYHGDLLRTINDDGANGISIFDIKQNQGETDEEYFFRKLLKLKGLLSERALFVLDNYDTVEDSYLEYLIQIGCRMIITTRMDHSDKGLPVLHMDYLPVFDQINLMKRYCKQIRTSEDEKVASAIVQMVDGHTLTIILLAELMQRKHIGPTKMVTMLDHYGLYSVLNEKIHGGGSTALERIRRVFNMFSLSSDEKHILTNMSLMPISGIDFSLFVELCELEDGSVVDDLIRSSWLLYDSDQERIIMHPLIAEMVRNEFQTNSQTCDCLLNNLAKTIKNSHLELTNEEVYTYCSVVEAIYAIDGNILFSIDELWVGALTLLARAGKHGLAIKISKDNIQYQIAKCGEQSEIVALSYYRLKDLYYGWGNVAEGLPYGVKALDIIRVVKPNSIAHVYLSASLAISYPRDDKHVWDESFNLLQESNQALQATDEISSIYFGTKDWNAGTLYNYFALIYNVSGQYEKALQFSQRSYDAYMKCSSIVEKNSCSNALTNMAEAYSLLHEKDKAIQTIRLAVEWRRKDMNPDHINYLRFVLKHEVNVYINLHMYEEALAILQDLERSFLNRGYMDSPYYDQLTKKIESVEKLMVCD